MGWFAWWMIGTVATNALWLWVVSGRAARGCKRSRQEIANEPSLSMLVACCLSWPLIVLVWLLSLFVRRPRAKKETA